MFKRFRKQCANHLERISRRESLEGECIAELSKLQIGEKSTHTILSLDGPEISDGAAVVLSRISVVVFVRVIPLEGRKLSNSATKTLMVGFIGSAQPGPPALTVPTTTMSPLSSYWMIGPPLSP